MRLSHFSSILFATSGLAVAIGPRDGGFADGQPIDGKGKGAPISGGTNHELDLQNLDNLGRQSTDNGVVPNLKWSFSDSKTRILKGGWVRESVITDLPSSHDISGAQQHLTKGSIRELHWHKVAEWGYVYTGKVLISAVDEHGQYEVAQLEVGDAWYFPKGVAHAVQGLENENEFLLIFDDGNFDAVGVTFNIDDWLTHIPKSVLAKNFGLSEDVFGSLPSPNPYILNSTVSTHQDVTGGNGKLSGNASFVYYGKQHGLEPVPGGGGTFRKIDSTTFPASKTIAATVVTLVPGGLRELHWHPNAEEWLYFHQGNARASVFIGNSQARTFDFSAGDTAVFPDNSGHYIENTGDTDLVWLEFYKSDRVADIPLTQWLALTPSDVVAATLKVPLEIAESLKSEKQVLIKPQ
ncbi:thermophilic glucose-6-phosphate isomerase [Xylariaceae sp. FL0662B]|nr:thermophilic glucose-6-phosphate isomerase [Xylariaceae sp. FL0662B]